MKRLLLAATILISCQELALAQTPVQVSTVVDAEKSFDKLVERKGIKDAFLQVADPEGIVFKPDPIKISEFYSQIDKQPGTLVWEPKFARISANGDLAFTSGPYVYQNGKTEDDKVYGDYVSVWRLDPTEGKLRLLIDLGIQHPEPEQQEISDVKDPDPAKRTAPSKDPFSGKSIIIGTDKTFNHALETYGAMATYKEFLSPESRYYFPGFELILGQDKIMKFIGNEAISISAETINAGRAASGDLAYSYGRARIKKGEVVSNYNYVRIWEIDKDHKWNVLLEVFSAIEQ